WRGSWRCARRSPTPTAGASSTATSSRPTSCSGGSARRSWSTGGSPRRCAAKTRLTVEPRRTAERGTHRGRATPTARDPAPYSERWPARAARWARRHRVAVGAIAAGLLVAAVLGSGGGVWLAREAADRRAERARLQAKDHDAVDQALAALPELARAYRFREAEALINQTA